MKIGFVGLGRMGMEMAGRLVKGGHCVKGYDISSGVKAKAQEYGIEFMGDLAELCESLEIPKIVWLQAPAGAPTNQLLAQLGELLGEGDILVDGGNSDFRDTLKNRDMLQKKGIYLVDCGVSGGVQGAREGAGLLVGADQEIFDLLTPVFMSLCAKDACTRAGGQGAGHYAKMVHNAVQYALMEGYAEGYELLRASDIDIDVLAVMNAWQQGCSIRSYLLEVMVRALTPDVQLKNVEGVVQDSGMGRWALEEAIRLRVPTPALAISLQQRFRSQQEESPAMKSLAAARGEIGGHSVQKKTEGSLGKAE